MRRLLAAIDAGTSHAQVAATFRVSERTLSRWLSRRHAVQPIARVDVIPAKSGQAGSLEAW